MFRRRHAFGSGSQRSLRMRLASMICLAVLLGMLVDRARDPLFWRWLAPHEAGAAVTPKISKPATPWKETIVDGPDDRDPAEQFVVMEQFDAVSDRTELAVEEMPAYWRLMNWSRTGSFADLDARARRDVVFAQLWSQPEKYRGELLHMRLHIRRALMHEAPTNKAGVKQVYELWGWTEESKSFPYVVLCSELPPGITLGAEVHEEAIFSGYFLKLLAYEAFDKPRAAPLLIGRLEEVPEPPAMVIDRGRNGREFWGFLALGGTAMVGFALVSWRRKPKAAPLPELSIEARNFDTSTFGDDDSAFNDSGPTRFTEPQDDSRDVILSAVDRSRIS